MKYMCRHVLKKHDFFTRITQYNHQEQRIETLPWSSHSSSCTPTCGRCSPWACSWGWARCAPTWRPPWPRCCSSRTRIYRRRSRTTGCQSTGSTAGCTGRSCSCSVAWACCLRPWPWQDRRCLPYWSRHDRSPDGRNWFPAWLLADHQSPRVSRQESPCLKFVLQRMQLVYR
jgi:hypothetical protein